MPRKHQRVPLSLEAISEASSGRHEARVSDLSMGGCYVDSIVTLQAGENVVLSIRMPTGEWMKISAEVTYSLPGMGYGVSFTDQIAYDVNLLEGAIRASGGEPFDYEDDFS